MIFYLKGCKYTIYYRILAFHVFCKFANHFRLNMKERIEWIDTAKGICILLVVLTHAANPLGITYPLADVLITFRMPLYFILSGLFFKTYNGFGDFIVRKINKLIIPYTFFFLLLSVFIPFALYQWFDFTIWGYTGNGIHNLAYIFSENLTPNPAIWFLVSLFEVNILFYLIYLIAQKSTRKKLCIIILTLIIGFTGLIISIDGIKWPYYLDTSFSALPFFVFGWYIRNESNYLYEKKSKLYILIIAAIAFALIVHYFSFGPCYFRLNSYGKLGGLLQLYPYGIIGSLIIFEFARYMGKVPFLSFVGRYSIIVLCIHSYVIQCMTLVFSPILSNQLILWDIVFITSAALCGLLIYPFKKYLGYFTAQKNLFKLKIDN